MEKMLRVCSISPVTPDYILHRLLYNLDTLFDFCPRSIRLDGLVEVATKSFERSSGKSVVKSVQSFENSDNAVSYRYKWVSIAMHNCTALDLVRIIGSASS